MINPTFLILVAIYFNINAQGPSGEMVELNMGAYIVSLTYLMAAFLVGWIETFSNKGK